MTDTDTNANVQAAAADANKIADAPVKTEAASTAPAAEVKAEEKKV